jgi:carbon-monoxide dehydrogenase medium subunit
VKPPPFSYHRAETLGEALELLAEHGSDASVLAGGQSLVPVLSLRVARPEHVIDINRVAELGAVSRENGTLALGALVRQREALESAEVAAACPLLSLALPFVGHPETRNRGTLGGSLAHNDPAAELGTVVVALDGELVLRSAARGERRLPAREFLLAPYLTAREPDELVTELRLPAARGGSGWAFDELSRRHHDFAVVGVAAGLELARDGTISAARLAFAGAGGCPLRAPAAEALLAGEEPGEELFAEAASRAAAELDPPSDVLASAGYRRHVAGVLARRALAAAERRAQGVT